MLRHGARITSITALSLSLLMPIAMPIVASAQVPGVPPPYPPPSAKTEAILLGSITAGVLVGGLLLNHSLNGHGKHLKGCVTAGPSALQIQHGAKIYILQDVPPNVRRGELVSLHGYIGSEVKGGNVRVFKITAVDKNYGACPSP